MSEVRNRIIYGLILSAMFIIGISYEGYFNIAIYILCMFFGFLALGEFYEMARLSDTHRPFRRVGFIGLFILITMAYFHALKLNFARAELTGLGKLLDLVEFSFHGFTGVLFTMMAFAFLRQLITNRVEGSIHSISSTLMGMLYIGIPFTHFILLKSLDYGTFYVWLVSFATAMSDVIAYFAGRFLGKHRVGIQASPNKTWEGYLIGLAGQVALTHIFYNRYAANFEAPVWSGWLVSLFGVNIFIASVIGDLSESLFKRDSNRKDSSNLIPGHGGILDVIDALMLTIPGLYYCIIFVQKLQSL